MDPWAVQHSGNIVSCCKNKHTPLGLHAYLYSLLGDLIDNATCFQHHVGTSVEFSWPHQEAPHHIANEMLMWCCRFRGQAMQLLVWRTHLWGLHQRRVQLGAAGVRLTIWAHEILVAPVVLKIPPEIGLFFRGRSLTWLHSQDSHLPANAS